MFKCKICGKVPEGIKQQKVIAEIRNVNYIYMIKIDKIGVKEHIPIIIDSYFKTVKTSKGLEIVKEDIYCPRCLPKKIIPRILNEEVTREVILKTIREKEGFKKFRRGYR